MKKLLAAVLMVVLATPAFAAIQNVKVSGQITTTFLDRNNFNLGEFNQTEYNNSPDHALGVDSPDSGKYGLTKQNVFITQTILRADADLSDNVSTTVGLINERAWNAENTPNTTGSALTSASVSNLDTNVQLYLASITLREFLYSPLTLTIGRQTFNFGNGFIIGDGLPNQSGGNLQYIAQDLTQRTSYDGVTAVLDYKPLTISMIYFKNGQTNNSLQGLYGSNSGSSDYYGVDAAYQLSDPMSTLVEGYMFDRFNGDNYALEGPGTPAGAADKGDTLYVPGLRASTNPIKGLNVQGEVAWQLGQHPVTFGTAQEAERRDAFGAQFMASYALPVLDKYKPTVNASYTYVSGDKNGSENDNSTGVVGSKSAKIYSAWDPMIEGQGVGTIWNTLFTLSNMNILSAGASISPLEDVTATFTWSDLWAADSYTAAGNQLALYQPNGGTNLLYPDTKAGARGLGNEFDVNLTYNYTEDVTFGVSLGWFAPGSAFAAVSNAGNGLSNKTTASQAEASVGVKF